MKSLNKISLIFAIIFVMGFSIFLAQKTSAAPILTCDSAHCNLCIEMDNCESSGCIWRPALNRCVQPVESTPVPTDYNPPAGFCPGFSAKYSSDGTLAEIRTSCFGTGKAYHNVDLYAPNSSPYYLTLNPEQTCYSPDIPTFNEIENCNNLPLSWGDTSNSVIAQLFSKFLSKVKILLGNTAEALPYGHCYAPQEVCTNFYPWQIYHAEVFTTYISDPEDCQMEIQLRNKANQNISNSYYGSTGKLGCGPASNTQGIGGLTVTSDDASAAKFWQHVSLDGSMFDAVQWEGYVKYWAKRVSFRNFDIQARTINKGDSVTVSWNVLNATKVFLFIGESACKSIHIPEKPIDPKCVLDHANTLRLSNSGSVYLYPSETTNFYLYAYGPSGEGSQFILNGPIKVIVTEATPTPTPTSQPEVDIKANGKDGPISIASGSSVDLSWTSSNLGTNPSCTASGAWSGAKATSGSENTGALTSSKTYTLTCSGSKGSASDSVRINMAGAGQGTIVVRARLDGEVWTGNIGYTLSGPETITGTAVRKQHSNVTAGSYTLTLISGGPSNATLDNISPAPSLSLSSGGTIIFTLNFKTSGPTHKECNVSKRCVAIVGEGSDTCTDDVSCGWLGDTHKECNASKRCVDVSGSGADTCTDDVSCGWLGDTHKECDASDKCVDVSGVGADQCINDTSCNLPDNGFVCNFSWSPESPKAKSAIDFFDYTQTPEGTTLTSWTWIFEDGTPASSSDQNPGSVIFNSAGEKTVTLQATNSDNDTCTFNQEITVQSLNPKWIEVIPK